ncbi:hypothetical protein BDW69DRAFT_171327 [Aspergillus filifer]
MQIKTTGSDLLAPHWANQDLPALDTLIDSQTFAQFWEAMATGLLSTGQRTNLPTLNPDELHLFMRPSVEWAPAPFNTSTIPTIVQLAQRLVSEDDTARICRVGQNINSLRSRLMDGFVPMSGARWAEKGLDKPENFDLAIQQLTAVIVVFEYLNMPQVRQNMRDTFNLISDDLKDFENALNARRKIHDPSAPELDLTASWVEFTRAKYEVATGAAHSWVLARQAELDKRNTDDRCNVPDVLNKLNSEEIKVYNERSEILTRITIVADLMIWMSMDGYKGYQPSAQITPGLEYPDLDARRKKYHENLYEKGYTLLESFIAHQTEHGTLNTLDGLQQRLSVTPLVQEVLRKELRGKLLTHIPPVMWIESVLVRQKSLAQMDPEKRKQYSLGLAIYRAAYHNISDEEWETIKRNMEAHLADWGDNIPNADKVKPLLKLHWFDCKELGIDPKDTAAVRSHFHQTRLPNQYKFDPRVFLLLDDWAAASYKSKPHPALADNKQTPTTPGDSIFQGHLLAIDPEYTAPEHQTPDERAATENLSPGYAGHMRILGNLIWPDLFGMTMMNHNQILFELWPLAREHPQKCYVGTTVPGQVEKWREYTELKEPMMEMFQGWLEKKCPESAERMREIREKHMI